MADAPSAKSALTAAVPPAALFADRGFGGLSLAGGGGLPTRLAGGTLALTVLGTAIIGLMLGTRTGRLYERFEVEAVELARAGLSARMEGVARQLAWSVARSEDQKDWSPLQTLLPSLTQGDAELSAIVVTDEDGLVVAASDPKQNGLPLANPLLRALLSKPSNTVQDIALADGPALARVEHTGGRILWIVGRLTRAEEARRTIARAAHEAVRLGWVLVTLGGLVVALVAVGAVALVGRSLARGLSAISWRIGQLGLGDRSTHLSLDGPLELRQIGLELERAARRIEASEAVRTTELRADAVSALHRSLSDQALASSMAGSGRVGGLEVGHALGPTPLALALGTRTGEKNALAWLVEVASKEPGDLLTATAYGAQASMLARDAMCSPAALLAGLDRDGPHARAAVLAILDGGARVRVAAAGAHFPLLHRVGAERIEVVIARGDRLGAANAARGDEIEVKLEAGDALYFYCDAGATVGGHVPRGLDVHLATLNGNATQRASALVELGVGAAYVFLRRA